MTTRQSPKTKTEENGQPIPEPEFVPPELQFVPVMHDTWAATMNEVAELRAVLTRHAAVLDDLYILLSRSGRQ